MRWEIVRRTDELATLLPAWEALWRESGARPVTLHPEWIDAWWRVLGGSGAGLEGDLLTVLVREGDSLVGVAPFYLAPPHGGTLRLRELRLLGDGLVGVLQAVLALAGYESRVRDLVIEALSAEPGWDLLDLTFELGSDASSEAEALGRGFAELGRSVERSTAEGRREAVLVSPWDRFVEGRRLPESVLSEALAPSLLLSADVDGAPSPERLALLERLVGRKGVAGDAALDGAVLRLLERALGPLSAAGVAELRLLSAPDRGVVAGSVVLTNGDRHVELLRAGDAAGSDQLLLLALRRATTAGARRFQFAASSGPPSAVALAFAGGKARGERLRVFRRSATAAIHRGYATLVRHATQVAGVARVPMSTISRLRGAAPDAVTRAVARVATFSQLHLYRGELFVRNGKPPHGTTIRLFSIADFLALDDKARFLERLDLAETYTRLKWDRGDLVVLALCDEQPAGILWCARGPVFVPDIGREVRPAAGECYIHDVYVTPAARGRAVAPAMLEFLARELRARDIYRAWALIERSNMASTRAFEKAAWASVADVIYARMGRASKLIVRPPDPEARAFLGFKTSFFL